MIIRRADGSIPEKQDRPGCSKHWQYIIQYQIDDTSTPGYWHTHNNRYARLDDALSDVTNILPGVDRVQIVQETITTVWDSGEGLP